MSRDGERASRVRVALADAFRHGGDRRGAATWVCFPFAEWSYGPWDRDARSPPLAAAFAHGARWCRTADAVLARAASRGRRAAAAAGAAIVARLPDESAQEDLAVASPFALVRGISLTGCLCAGRHASIYAADVDLSDGGGGGGDGTSRARCALKIINVRLAGDFEHGWRGTRRRRRTDGVLVCSPAWAEPVALSRVYPDHFFGCATFFCAADGDWYVCLAMPLYRSTLWHLTAGVEPRHAGPAGGPWAGAMLAALAQIVLYTLPRAKRRHLVAHNDFKVDNVAYRRTSRRHLYVRIAGFPLLAIPTHGRLFYLIDFGWASVACAGPLGRAAGAREAPTASVLRVESASCRLAAGPAMRAWNACTDPAQAAYSLTSVLAERMGLRPEGTWCTYEKADEAWWTLIDAMAALMAVGGREDEGDAPADDRSTPSPPSPSPHSPSSPSDGARVECDHDGDVVRHTTPDPVRNPNEGDGGPRVLQPRDSHVGTRYAWETLFYTGVSRSCHMARARAFVSLVASIMGTEGPDPPSRRVMTYPIEDLWEPPSVRRHLLA